MDNKNVHTARIVSVGSFPQGLWSQDSTGKLIIWGLLDLDQKQIALNFQKIGVITKLKLVVNSEI